MAAPIRGAASGSSSSEREAPTCTARESIQPNSEVISSTFGVLKLTLKAKSYEWQFVPIPGKSFTDFGTGECHGDRRLTAMPASR